MAVPALLRVPFSRRAIPAVILASWVAVVALDPPWPATAAFAVYSATAAAVSWRRLRRGRGGA